LPVLHSRPPDLNAEFHVEERILCVGFPDNEEQQEHAESRSNRCCRTALFVSLSLFEIALARRIQTERLQDHSYQRRLRSSILVLAGSVLVRAKAQVEVAQW